MASIDLLPHFIKSIIDQLQYMDDFHRQFPNDWHGRHRELFMLLKKLSSGMDETTFKTYQDKLNDLLPEIRSRETGRKSYFRAKANDLEMELANWFYKHTQNFNTTEVNKWQTKTVPQNSPTQPAK